MVKTKSTQEQKKKKGKKAEGEGKRERAKKEKKEEPPVVVVEEVKKAPEIPTVADAVPSVTVILGVVKRMKDAEEARRLQDEETMRAWEQAEAERG